ncbi:MAG: hypothetical protein HY751_03155 [Nitrospinae bacterium]|nr:hypothetical protein [Nitrospinota bacterium]
MRCPYCSYVSFEFLDTCKKCSKDLSSHKQQYGIEFLEPVSLGVLTFVEGAAPSAEPSAPAGFSFHEEADHGILIEDVSAPSAQEPAVAEFSADDIKLDFGESTEEILSETGGTEDIGIKFDAGIDEIASDSGFTLSLGDELDIGMGDEKTPAEETGGSISLGEPEEEGGIVMRGFDEEDEGGITLSALEEKAAAVEEPGEIVIGGSAAEEEEGISLDLDIEGIGDIEIKDAKADEDTVKIEGAAAKTAKKPEEDDFADIELSLDDKDLFGEKGGDEEIDLGDLDLQIGDDDLGLKL